MNIEHRDSLTIRPVDGGFQLVGSSGEVVMGLAGEPLSLAEARDRLDWLDNTPPALRGERIQAAAIEHRGTKSAVRHVAGQCDTDGG